MSIFRSNLFRDKVAIVTGGATGIGRAITEELVTLGCKVVIASRKEERLSNAVKEISPHNDHVKFKVCNIRKEDQVRDLVSFTLSEYGKIDYLVNNGGGQFPSLIKDISLKGWNAVIETNLTGTFLMCKEAYKEYMSKYGGSIVNIIADMFRGLPYMGHTGAARAAVENLTKTLAIEWAENGVRVNAVAPGSSIYSETASANYGGPDIFEAIKSGVPYTRLGTPQEVSSAVCFLLSPAASFITGATLRVDAGGSLYSPSLLKITEHNKMTAYSWKYSPPEENEKSKL